MFLRRVSESMVLGVWLVSQASPMHCRVSMLDLDGHVARGNASAGSSTASTPRAAESWSSASSPRTGSPCPSMLEASSVWEEEFVHENNLFKVNERVYRSKAMSKEAFLRVLGELGIRTVIDLRVKSAQTVMEARWVDLYNRGRQSDQGCVHLVMGWQGHVADCPAEHRDAILALAEKVDEAQGPVLIHCAEGVNRTGVACCVAQLLQAQPVDIAIEQLTEKYGSGQIRHTIVDTWRLFAPSLALSLRAASGADRAGTAGECAEALAVLTVGEPVGDELRLE